MQGLEKEKENNCPVLGLLYLKHFFTLHHGKYNARATSSLTKFISLCKMTTVIDSSILCRVVFNMYLGEDSIFYKYHNMTFTFQDGVIVQHNFSVTHISMCSILTTI